MSDESEPVKKKKRVWVSRVLTKDDKSLALKKLVTQIVSDVNQWQGAFEFSGRISYTLNNSNRDAYLLLHKESLFTKTPIGTIHTLFDETNVALLTILIYPVGKGSLDERYTTLFKYLMTRKSNIRMYGAVFYDREPKNVTVEISTKELT